MLHLVKPAEGDGLDIFVSATAVPIDDERLRLSAGANPAGRGACFTVTFPHG